MRNQKQTKSVNNYLHGLPEDLLDLLVTFADIPSLGALCQTCRPSHGTISYVASREKVWLRMFNLRFHLISMKPHHNQLHQKYLSNSKLYGGPTWKDAYRAMALTCRMPKMGAKYKKKHIFNKGSTVVVNDDSQQVLAHKTNFVAAWLMINHTEDCRLRYFSNYNHHHQDLQRPTIMSRTAQYGSLLQYDHGVVYIQLQLAVQNTKSSCSKINVDVGSTTIQMYTSNGSIMTQRIIQSGVLGPKVIYKSRRFVDEKYEGNVSLEPFEFAVIAINVPLSHQLQQEQDQQQYHQHITERMHFETDFLSRARSICIPATCERSNVKQTGTELHAKEKTVQVCSTLVIARFISENEIWDRYMELPGNCLVLIDRRD